ncbi:epoxide hydrolase [Trichonephila inaurata madagascariensis]|uniref:Epoxide hydrolase n=1 Tax=Trichonephila inaurata madagascariensis TaxID=2747483 RepID=A0A8X6XJN8_9ARAC|nr:epoxide hydrolase [Trichonephila inaurata madagascariensis]
MSSGNAHKVLGIKTQPHAIISSPKACRGCVLALNILISLNVPFGFAFFPNELVALPRCLMGRSVTQLVSYTIMPRGGHFAAFEEPQLLADDIWNFVSLVQKMK